MRPLILKRSARLVQANEDTEGPGGLKHVSHSAEPRRTPQVPLNDTGELELPCLCFSFFCAKR